MADLAGEVRELFEARNFAHLATTLPDGSPHSVPVWMRVEDGKLLFFTQTQSRKARNLQRDPRVAISITDERNPYRSAWVRGPPVPLGSVAQSAEHPPFKRRRVGSTPTGPIGRSAALEQSGVLVTLSR